MIFQWKSFLQRRSGFVLKYTLCFLAELSLVGITEPLYSATNAPVKTADGRQSLQVAAAFAQEQHPPRRKPPRPAIDACSGKTDGDSCTFSSPHGAMEGVCKSGSENIFACRPTRSENRETSKPATEHGRQTEPSSENKTGDAVNATEKSLSDQQPQSSLKSQKENLPSPLPPSEHPPLPPPVLLADQAGKSAGWLLWASLLSAIMATGVTWYSFFKYSTVPLRRLRKVTQQLAGGDLTARVGEGLLHRKNEVVDLGRDVDRMAERIESLVVAHQRLIRDVSHELRSPLARLNVALELARQSTGSSHSAPFDRIERESERLNELIGQLLTLTKMESQSGMAKRTEIDISSLIEEIAHDVDYEARNLNRRVEIVVSDTVIFSGSRELIHQAFENVIRNAVRYTADGTAVEIICRRRSGKGKSFGHIEIRDHGPGVPESEIFNIFRPFYRVADARERQSGGTGVGLAISDRAVRLHGGSIRAINATGEGLIVEIELPLE